MSRPTRNRPRVACTNCDRVTQAADGLCLTCKKEAAPPKRTYPPRIACKTCTKGTRSETGVCRRCSPAVRGADSRCISCGARTQRADRHCHTCTYWIATAQTYRPSAEDALTGGKWVPVGGVMRWEAA